MSTIICGRRWPGQWKRRIEEGLRIANALVRFWEIRGYVREGLAWYERLLAQAGEDVSVSYM